ncbi:hypothetical protein ScPMuIL_014261 [Solemya velum]
MILLTLHLKLALGFVVAGLILDFIGLVTPYWAIAITTSNQEMRLGFWTHEYTGIFTAAKGFSVLGFMLYVALTIVFIIYLTKGMPQMILTSLILAFVTAGVVILGCIFWASGIGNYNASLSWSFFMCAIAGILAAAAGGCITSARNASMLVVSGTSSSTTRTTRTVVVSA